MIRAEIPQDVTQYKEEFIGGLTFRKLISVAAAAAVGIPAFLLLKNFIDTSYVLYICLVLIIPILLIGFKEIDGMPFEKYASLVISLYVKEQRRKYIFHHKETDITTELRKVLLECEKAERKAEIKQEKKDAKLRRKEEKKEHKRAKKEERKMKKCRQKK